MKTPRARKTNNSVRVATDPALKKKWLALIEKVRTHAKHDAAQWDAEWEAVGQIVEHHPPLYELGGYNSSVEFFRTELGVDDRVGRAYVRVAEHATPQDELEYTVWRLDAAIGWLEAVRSPLSPGVPIDFSRVRIGGKPLAECSVALIKEATARARGGKNAGGEKAVYRDALSKAFSKHAAFGTVRIREAHGKTSFYGVPNASLRTFAELVLEAALPGAVPKRLPKKRR